MPNVISSNIKSVGHSDKGLLLTFKSGKEYLYPGVPKLLYEQMLDADSVGKFFAQHIKPDYLHDPNHIKGSV
jgi:hypothetical protein